MYQTLVINLILILVSALILVNAQTGPVPPRLSIPGAVPVGGAVPHRPQFRNEKLTRVRKPVALRSQDLSLPAITPRTIEEPKPVTEAEEDHTPDVYLPQLLREQQIAQAQQAQFQQTAAAFFGGEPNSIQDVPTILNEEPLAALIPQTPAPVIRLSERPQPRPQFNDYGIGAGLGSQRFGLERPQASLPPPVAPQRSNVIRTRPVYREPRPQYEPQNIVERNPPPPPPQASRPRPKPIQSRPIDQNVLSDDRDTHSKRQRQPVAQTLRKWREENEDGSITWGYENDDGSFKEEIIGTDCITKGTYGYVDPDGNKREYHYETGIKCDPNARETDEELQENGFINYEENKAVLPNGIEIDMSQLGKKKSRRPGAIQRDPPTQIQQNQYYRN